MLPVRGSARVKVSFTAVEEKELAPQIGIEFADNEGGLDSTPSRSQKLFVKITAAAYKIKAVAFDEPAPGEDKPPGGTLDFGVLPVGEMKQESFTLKNHGKYDIDFAFSIRKAQVRDLFAIAPPQGTIAAGKSAEEKRWVPFKELAADLCAGQGPGVAASLIGPKGELKFDVLTNPDTGIIAAKAKTTPALLFDRIAGSLWVPPSRPDLKKALKK